MAKMRLVNVLAHLGFVVILCLLHLTDADDLYRCPSHLARNRYLKTHARRCYEFIREERHWFAARENCQNRGGTLITIEERHIQAFVEVSLNDLRWNRNGLWIGATDDHKERDWRWVTGARVDSGFSNWDRGQPSCFVFTFMCKEDCACLRLDDGFKWHDYFCRQSGYYYSSICQYDMLPETTTTTTTTQKTTTTSSTTSTTTTSVTSTPVPVPDIHVVQAATVALPQHNLLQTNGTIKQSTITASITTDKPIQVESQRIVSDEEGVQTGSVVGMVVSFVLIFIAGLVVGVFLCRRRYRKQYEESASAGFNNVLYTSAPQRPKDTNLMAAGGMDSDNDADEHRYCDIDEIAACTSHVKLPNIRDTGLPAEDTPSKACAFEVEEEQSRQEGGACGSPVPPPPCDEVVFRQFTPEFLSKDTDVSQAYSNNLYGYHK